MDTYKLVACNRPMCTDEGCPYWHSAKDKRRPLQLHYEGLLCLDAVSSECCPHENCTYARNLYEFQFHPANYKRVKCGQFRLGLPCSDQHCPYFHNNADKARQVESAPIVVPPPSNSPRKVPVAKPQIREKHYFFGQPMTQFEDKNTEFKHCLSKTFNPSNAVKTIVPYISAYLNTDGGTIYYGVQDDGRVMGIMLSRELRDNFLLQLDGEIGKFNPHLSSDLYSVEFVRVFNEKHLPVENLYVVEIHIKQGARDAVYFTGRNEAYIRRNASITMLVGPALISFYDFRKRNGSG